MFLFNFILKFYFDIYIYTYIIFKYVCVLYTVFYCRCAVLRLLVAVLLCFFLVFVVADG